MNRFRKGRLVGLVAGLAISVALTDLAIGQEVTPRVIDVKIEKRKVVAPKRAIRITEDEVVELRWSTDEPVQLHLHGYDKELDVRPGKPASMSITGKVTGRFPITSHGWGTGGHGHHALTYLEVYPR